METTTDSKADIAKKDTLLGLGSSVQIPEQTLEFDLQYDDMQDADNQLRNKDLEYHDVPFTILFLAIVIAYCICWFYTCDLASITSLLSPPKYESPNNDPSSPIQGGPLSTSPITSLFFSAILVVSICITLISLFAKFVSNYVLLMKASYIFNAAIFGTAAVYFFANNFIYNGVISFMVCMFTLLFMKSLQSKFERSATLLKLIITIIKKNPIISIVSLSGSFLSIAFMFTWMILLSQIVYKWNQLIKYQNGDYSNPVMILTTIFSIFSGAYITEVIRNSTLTCLSSIYSSWYFNLKKINITNSILEIKNTLTYKFGSICLGSFLASLLELSIQSIDLIRAFITDRGSFLHLILTICSFFLTLLEDLMRYFNSYVFSLIALFGNSFIQSSKKIIEKVKQQGWPVIQNDCIISNTVQSLSLTISLITSGCCYLYLRFHQPDFNSNNDFTLLYPLAGFILSAEICHVFYTAIMSGNNTIILALVFHPEVATHCRYQAYLDFFYDLQEQWPELHSLV